MFLTIPRWFRREPEPTPEEAFRQAIRDFNDAWELYELNTPRGHRVRPWMDWERRRLVITTVAFNTEEP